MKIRFLGTATPALAAPFSRGIQAHCSGIHLSSLVNSDDGLALEACDDALLCRLRLPDSPTCLAHKGLYTLSLRPALICCYFGQESGCPLALQHRIFKLYDEAMLAYLPVLPVLGAFKTAQQRHRAAEMGDLFQLDWRES